MMPKHERIILLFLALLATASYADLQFQGKLTDPYYTGVDSLRVEVVETGETTPIGLDKKFTLSLPRDTVWNLCVLSSKSEKCYELKYLGKDSIFALELTGEALITWYDDGSSLLVPDVAQTSNDSSSAPATDTVDVEALLQAQGSSVTELKKVVVQLRKRPKRKMGESVVSAKRIKRLPGLAEADVIRTLQALPGVVASSDFSTKIYVRGGGADQNLFLLDNGVVYSPVHFFGLFSTFLVEGIDDVKFYKGGFSPEYGNRLSSVVDIKSRKGGSDTTDALFHQSSVKISTFATQAHTEGKQGDTRWLLAARTTYIKEVLDAMNDGGIIDFQLDYRFTDVQGNIRHDLDEDHWIGLSVYTGRDKLDFSPLTVDWGNTVVPLNFGWRLTPRITSLTSLSYSAFDQSFGLTDIFSLYNDIKSYNMREHIEHEITDEQTLQYGADITAFDIIFRNEQKVIDETFLDRNKFMLYALYLNDTWRPENWEINLGLRANYQDLAQHVGLEPRLSVQRRFENDQSVSFHAGRYLQYINSILFSDQETLNEFYYPVKKATLRTLEPTSSLLLSLGYAKERLWEDYSFSLEGYFKTQDNLLVFSEAEMAARLDSLGATFNSLADLFKSGEGYSMGYEVSLRKNEGIINGGINWSQGFSVVLEEWDSVPYFPDWHQPYALKGDLGLTWKGKDGLWPHKKPGRFLRSSMQLKYASGLPFTEKLGYYRSHEIDQSIDDPLGGPNPEFDNRIVVPHGDRNTSLQPDYFRFDIKVIDMGRENKWNFSWTILNVTGNENIFLYTYDTTTNPPTLDKITQFPFFPVLLNYEYYF